MEKIDLEEKSIPAATGANIPVLQQNIINNMQIESMFSTNTIKFINTPIGTKLDSNMLAPSESDYNILQSLIKQPKLAEGASGEVFELKGSNKYILKKVKCPAQYETPEFNINCERIQNKTIFQTIYSSEGECVTLPTSISESVIGVILNDISIHTPHFVKNYGVIWGENYNVFSLTDRLKTNIEDIIKNGEDFLIFFIQALHGYSVSQHMHKFTHNDSHIENFLYEKNKNKAWNEYIIKDFISPTDNEFTTKKIYVKNNGWNIKINDYGISRLQSTVKPRVYNGVIEGESGRNRLYGKFSHCVDYLTILGLFVYENLDITLYHKNFQNKVKKIRDMIVNDYFLINLMINTGFKKISHFLYSFVCSEIYNGMTTEELDAKIAEIYNNQSYYRPSTDYIYIYQHTFYTPSRVILNLLDQVQKKYLDLIVLGFEDDDSDIKDYNEYKEYVPVFNNYPYNIYFYPGKDINSPNIVKLSDVLFYSHFVFSIGSKRSYNLAENPSIDCNINLNQNIHIIKIDLKKAQESNLKFVSDCCGIDVIEYMQQKPDRYGVAINGVFFDIFNSNKPIGSYKQNNTIINGFDIPKKYKDLYGIIGFKNKTKNSQGIFVIESINSVSKDVLNSLDFYAMCGPILIKNKKPFITDVDLTYPILSDNQIKQEKILQCTKDGTGIGSKIDICQQGFPTEYITTAIHPSCRSLRPGELGHMGNLNPRSILGYNSISSIMYFIVIEGRELRGSGQDINMMIETLRYLDPEITDAINLDGGTSSCMAMKSEENSNTIIINNPYRGFQYPVGNIFAIVNK